MVIGRLESFPKKSLHHWRRGSTSVFWTLHLDISFMSYASLWLDVIYSQAAHVLVLWKTADTSVVLPASCPVRAGIHVMFWVNMANVLAHSCLFTYPADTFLTTCPKFTDCVLTSHHGLQYLAVCHCCCLLFGVGQVVCVGFLDLDRAGNRMSRQWAETPQSCKFKW